ncbi:hypothetical protein V500_11289 [Pseudogymnoascus sp. VKM F-4518 (FW-2643)]|nr:hypothetical protein V500_11289 [Pseudogymnoascus sp. VKM F-4518 (FW-2643)]
MKGANETVDAEEISMDQGQAGNGTVDLSDLGLELNKKMMLTLAIQLDAFQYRVEKITKLALTAKKSEGLPEKNADIAARKNLRQLNPQNYFNYTKMARKALEGVDNALQCIEGSGKSRGEALMMLPGLYYALEYFFGCRARLDKAWKEIEIALAERLEYFEKQQ